MHETILVIDFGAQYSEVIARRIRENNVCCEVLPWTTSTTFIWGKNPIGIVLSDTIKSHHNVGGLPENLPFKKIIEPLSKLFKDEVRELGLGMGIDEALVFRQPFPGPGLAVRIIGDITDEKLEILKEADYIFREVIAKNKYQRKISQYFAVLTNMQSVGVMGDKRTYQYAIALRAVSTDDFMTANYVRLPYRVLDEASRRIVNEVKGVNRVVYDITSKPPATIEYE